MKFPPKRKKVLKHGFSGFEDFVVGIFRTTLCDWLHSVVIELTDQVKSVSDNYVRGTRGLTPRPP